MTANTTTVARQIDVNGAQLYVEEHGAGEPIVLVQPGLVSSAVYQPLIPLLAQDHRVIAFDSRGHGRSTNPSGALSYKLIAEDAAALIDVLELERPAIGGWSDGGQVALEFGLRYPGRAGALIVGAASLEVAGEPAKAQMRSMLGIDETGHADPETFGSGIGAQLIPVLRQLHPNGEAHWQDVLQRSATMWMQYDGMTQAQVARITTPALIVVGDRDEMISLDGVIDLYRKLPDAELAILPGASHMTVLHDPALLAATILDFLNRHRSR